ncbi:MAG: putative sporulation protein YtxC [Bacillota bacterium]|nr:putative sporulation protein YtxC [Bacillota bacterium]
MVEIIFQNEMDSSSLFNHLIRCLKPCYHQNILLNEDRHILSIQNEDFDGEALKKLKKSFYNFIYEIKLEHWCRGFLKDHFYYEDLEEQQQIVAIFYSILQGCRQELPTAVPVERGESVLNEAINQIFLETSSFSFDSFVKFRLRDYFRMLESFLEVSIDEYKMEQEYQVFVQTLREFLCNRPSKMALLHIVFDEEITFFNEQFHEIKRSELIKMVDRKLLFNHPVYVDSVSIAPLLSIAPSSVVIYTQNPEQPLIRTIHNIFEERITIRSLSDFGESDKKNLSS